MNEKKRLATGVIAPAQNHYQSASATLALLAALLVLTCPGAVAGAVIIFLMWRATRPPLLLKCCTAAAGAATAAALVRFASFGWPWRLVSNLLAVSTPAAAPAVPVIGRSVLIETLLGPVLVLMLTASRALREMTILGQSRIGDRESMARAKALQPGWKPPGAGPGGPGSAIDPPGKIRLGVDESGRPFDLDPSEIKQHIFVPGTAGFGKTTTLVRLASGALNLGYAVIIVDCKGGTLADDARALAANFGVPYTLVDPMKEEESVGYNPCTGGAAAVGNKIVGAFTFGPEAEIYKNIAMEVVPTIVRGLQNVGDPVTLDAIYDALGKGGLSLLARRVENDDRLSDRLKQLGDPGGGVGASGSAGLRHRLGALLAGTFGDIFGKEPSLDWRVVTERPSVTCLSLSATAAGEDVELFARVITQDLKQLAAERMKAKEGDICPVMVMFDEFAALREAQQVTDLLLQSRQAQMPVVIATQYLPEQVPIRIPALQSGVVIVHRLGYDDSQQIVNELGTKDAVKLTGKVDFATGEVPEGSARIGDKYQVDPNIIRTLPVGKAVVYSRRTERRSVVAVTRDEFGK
jgi:hypothetical protein